MRALAASLLLLSSAEAFQSLPDASARTLLRRRGPTTGRSAVAAPPAPPAQPSGNRAVGPAGRVGKLVKRIAGDGIARANPQLAHWTSSHLLAAPSQRLLAGVSADQRAADRITVAGGLVNVALTIGKLAAGVWGRSAAMVSDAAHSASDLASDVVTLVAMRAARVPADADHPYGHGRFETIGALVVGGMLFTTGVGAALHALDHGLGHAHGLGQAPGVIALAAAAVSIVAKELLYRATARVGRRLRSPVLEANAWHHRSDAFSSVVALLGIALARVGASGPLAAADALAGLGVAAMLGATGAKVAAGALQELSDAVDHQDLSDLETSLVNLEGVERVASLRGRAVAGALRVDVDLVAAAPDLSTTASFQLAERARVALMSNDDDDEDDHSHGHGHSHGHSHGSARVVDANVRVVPAGKTCPVVAALPSPAYLEHLVVSTLSKHNGPAVRSARAHYVDGFTTALDVVLEAPESGTLDDLRAAAADATGAIDDALRPRLASVRNLWWAVE